MNKTTLMRLGISILLCLLAGVIGSIFTTPAISSWYAYLLKPDFSPPNWIFAPVWTTLFVLMGISFFLIWQKKDKDVHAEIGLMFFIGQLMLNVFWSLLFFGLKNPFFALLEIIVLWLAILITIIQFYKINRAAGILLIPYILWVSFAAVLNYFIWILNY